MQGVNYIYTYYEENRATNYSELLHVKSIKEAIETAVPGWFSNITYGKGSSISLDEVNLFTDSNENSFINIIINNTSPSYYPKSTTIYSTYQNGAARKEFRSTIRSDGNPYLNAIIYSNNFFALELSNVDRISKRCTPFFFAKTSKNKVAFIHNENYGSTTETNASSLMNASAICAHTFESGTYCNPGFEITHLSSAEVTKYYPNDFFYDNKVTTVGKDSRSSVDSDNISVGRCITDKIVLMPIIISGAPDFEYIPDVYYIKNNTTVFTNESNVIIEVGNDHYFSNGVVAVKLS